MIIHAIPLATGAGFARTTAAFGLTLTGFGNLCSKPLWGYTLPRVNPKWLVTLGTTIATIGISCILWGAATQNQTILFIGFASFGFGFGGTMPVGEFLWADFFGREHIGAIRGISYPVQIIRPTFMPILVGLWFDWNGNYQVPFLSLIVMYIIAAAAVWVAPRPQK